MGISSRNGSRRECSEDGINSPTNQISNAVRLTAEKCGPWCSRDQIGPFVHGALEPENRTYPQKFGGRNHLALSHDKRGFQQLSYIMVPKEVWEQFYRNRISQPLFQKR